MRSVALAAVLMLAAGTVMCDRSSEAPAAESVRVYRVLPFDVVGQDDHGSEVGRAVAGSIAVRLGECVGVRIADAPHGAVEADVDRVVEGTLIRDDGGAVRARVRVLDPTGAVVASTEVVTEDGDLAALTSDVARTLARERELSRTVLYEYLWDITGGPQMAAAPLTRSARDALRRGDRGALLEHSDALVAEFEDDVAAHVLNAWALLLSWDADPANEPRLRSLRERLEVIARLDAASPTDDLIRGYLYRSSGQPEPARVLYTRVLGRVDLSSGLRAWALRQRAYAHLQLGNPGEALDDAERALRLDPANTRSTVALSKALEDLDRIDDAIVRSEQALALQPSSWRHQQRLGLLYARADKFEPALEALERACRSSSAQESCANFAVTLARASETKRSEVEATEAATLPATRWGLYNLACWAAVTGRPQRALAELRKSVELGFADALIRTDPDLDSIRSDPAFERILADVERRLDTRKRMSMSAFPWQA